MAFQPRGTGAGGPLVAGGCQRWQVVVIPASPREHGHDKPFWLGWMLRLLAVKPGNSTELERLPGQREQTKSIPCNY